MLEPPMPIMDKQRDEWLNGKTINEMLKEAGLDPKLLGKIQGIKLIRLLSPLDTYKRLTFIQRGRKIRSEISIQKNFNAIRQIDFANDQLKELRTTQDFGVYFQNRYFESAIGRKKPLQSKWFKSVPWRASAVVPSGKYFMEYYAHSVNVFDPQSIVIGDLQ